MIVYPEVAFIRENYQFRSVIELHAIRAFLPRAGRQWLADMRTRHQDLRDVASNEAVAADLNSTFMTLDFDMHVSFVEALENRAISAAYARIMDNINLARQVHDRTALRTRVLDSLARASRDSRQHREGGRRGCGHQSRASLPRVRIPNSRRSVVAQSRRSRISLDSGPRSKYLTTKLIYQRSIMRLSEFRITRFQYPRDRVIGDSQVQIDELNAASLELIADDGKVGLGFIQSLFHPLPDHDEIVRVFEAEAWPALVGQPPASLVHRVNRPRGGNQRAFGLPFYEAIQVALWDLAAKQAGLPLHRFLGSRREPGPCLRFRPRLSPQRRRLRGVLRPRRCARIRGVQDQGRPPRLRSRPVAAETAEEDGPARRDHHDRCE